MRFAAPYRVLYCSLRSSNNPSLSFPLLDENIRASRPVLTKCSGRRCETMDTDKNNSYKMRVEGVMYSGIAIGSRASWDAL